MILKIIVLVIVGVTIYHLFPLIQIVGDSMYPTYKNSEILIGTRLFRISKLKVGDVVCYRSPMEVDRIVVKRIADIRNSEQGLLFFCLGDNSEVSYDSREYGYVPYQNLVCRIKTRNKEEI